MTEFQCAACSEVFSVRVWHCRWCDHHWEVERRVCANCYRGRPGRAPKGSK